MFCWHYSILTSATQFTFLLVISSYSLKLSAKFKMKVSAIVLALAGVGCSKLICRDVEIKTGTKDMCTYGHSSSSFMLMPFKMEIPEACHLTSGATCEFTVCGTKAEFAKPFEVVITEGKNSWNFDLYVDGEQVKPESVCKSDRDTYCCGMQSRLDKSIKSAEFTWPATSPPTLSPTRKPSSASPSRAPTPSPTTTDAPSRFPTTSPSRSPTPVRPCAELSPEECVDAGFCRKTNGKNGRTPCIDARCKKFRKDTEKCEEAPHCQVIVKRKSKSKTVTKCVSRD